MAADDVATPPGQAEIDLAGIRRVIESVDDARRYIQTCLDAGDSWEHIPDDYVARSALESWQGNPPWLSEREVALQARIDAALALIDEFRGGRPVPPTSMAALVRAALTGEEATR